jgi:hypothetical protein
MLNIMTHRLFLVRILFLLAFTEACGPKPKIEVAEILEIALEDRYDDYVKTLNRAHGGDRVAVKNLLLYSGFYDGATYEHGWVIIRLMVHLGDDFFSTEIEELSKDEVATMYTYLTAGLDIYVDSDELPAKYPKTFAILNLSNYPKQF